MGRETRTRTRLDPAIRREQILMAAATVFAGRDPADVTFEEIAAEAGVSRALVYNYFGDKGGLVAAVHLASIERLDRALDDALARDDTPEQRLRQVIICYLEFARGNAGAWNLVGSSEGALHPVVQQARQRRYRRMAEVWGGTAEAQMVARGIVCFLEGASRQWVDDETCDRDRVVHLLHTLLWSGIRHLPDAGLTLRHASIAQLTGR